MNIPGNWRLKEQRYRLVGKACSEGHLSFPPREVCRECADNREVKKEPEYIPQAVLAVAADMRNE